MRIYVTAWRSHDIPFLHVPDVLGFPFLFYTSNRYIRDNLYAFHRIIVHFHSVKKLFWFFYVTAWREFKVMQKMENNTRNSIINDRYWLKAPTLICRPFQNNCFLLINLIKINFINGHFLKTISCATSFDA